MKWGDPLPYLGDIREREIEGRLLDASGARLGCVDLLVIDPVIGSVNAVWPSLCDAVTLKVVAQEQGGRRTTLLHLPVEP